MPGSTPEQRSAIARIAVLTSWERTVDRAARTRHGQAGLTRKFEQQAREAVGDDAWDALPNTERDKRIDTVRKLHFTRLAFAASKARTAKARARRSGDVA
jgi:hypothetical protein